MEPPFDQYINLPSDEIQTQHCTESPFTLLDRTHEPRLNSFQESTSSEKSIASDFLWYENGTASESTDATFAFIDPAATVTNQFIHENVLIDGSMVSLPWPHQPMYSTQHAHTSENFPHWSPSSLSIMPLHEAARPPSTQTKYFAPSVDRSSIYMNADGVVSLQSNTHANDILVTPSRAGNLASTESVSSEPKIDQNYLHHCDDCRAIFPLFKPFQQHIKTHQKPHKCSACGKAFKAKKDLRRHAQTHAIESTADTQIRRGTFYYCRYPGCPFMQKGFGRRDNLLRHERKQHVESSETGENENEYRRRSKRARR